MRVKCTKNGIPSPDRVYAMKVLPSYHQQSSTVSNVTLRPTLYALPSMPYPLCPTLYALPSMPFNVACSNLSFRRRIATSTRYCASCPHTRTLSICTPSSTIELIQLCAQSSETWAPTSGPCHCSSCWRRCLSP